MPNLKEIFVRLDRCVGCHSCEIACAAEHSNGASLFEAIAETMQHHKNCYVEIIEHPETSLLCNYCDDAPCTTVCPVGALLQDDLTKIVTRNTLTCIECWTCETVCTYGVIERIKEYRTAIKCDRCPEKDVPACVSACPTGALFFSEEESLPKIAGPETAAVISNEYI